MTGPPTPDFFDREKAASYDERNRRLAPLAECLHFLVRLVLAELPERARILCVGCGTGAEILALAAARPGWTFTGVEPSGAMLEICRERLAAARILDRCTLIHGHAQDVPAAPRFDAALSLLVAHFLDVAARRELLRHMVDRLESGGRLVTAEISGDLAAPELPHMLADWARVQELMGATPESLADLPRQLREVLTVLTHDGTEQLLRECGVREPVRFFQAFLVAGWHGRVD
jgi:tRNA (cmo5U34)-methyltransferase